MAGSYSHCVDDEGRLLAPEDLCSISGDVYEAIKEMYGMIWLLAAISEAAGVHPELGTNPSRREVIEWARQDYRRGLELSPGTGASLPEESDE